MAQITYDDKVDLNTTQVADINKVKASDMNEIKETVNVNTPTGIVSIFAGTVAPDGWLICDGSAVSRTTYANLFNVIGTEFGEGDGNTTFNIPDFRHLIPVGLDSRDSDFNSIGKTGGEKTHTLTINEMPSHAHEQLAISNPNSGGSGIRGTYNGQEGTGMSRYSTNAQTGTTGGGQAHNNVQPYIVMNYIISY